MNIRIVDLKVADPLCGKAIFFAFYQEGGE
jgi:hypothetical protein